MARPTSLTAALASLAACAAALILPGQPDQQQPLRSALNVTALEDAFSPVSNDLENVNAAIGNLLDQVQSARGRLRDDFAKVVMSSALDDNHQDASAHPAPDHEPASFFDLAPLPAAAGGAPGRHVHGNEFDKVSIYTLLTQSSQCEHFLKYVDMFPSVVAMLNRTDEGDYTVFVPAPSAFEKLPDSHDKLPKEAIEKIVRYHIGIGSYDVKRIAKTYTIPTAAREHDLENEPQRLRVSFGLGGVKMNFYSKVIRTNIHSKNGIIHAVDHVLVPPPEIDELLNLFPDRFSTLLLAVEKADFSKFMEGVDMKRATLFAPTNSAWSWLGPKANAFLFNTEKGKKYLKALLKYLIAPDVVLYTDAIYDKHRDGHDGKDGERPDDLDPANYATEHYELDTLLGDARLSVDIAHVFGFAIVKVNGFTKVTLPNVPGKNGVIHVVNRVPLPPCKKRHGKSTDESSEDDLFGEIEVEDLMDRLEPYLE
ncbi:Stabilin-2 [Escovopsis weberi]|uniref:Stabilin-2 n=1 Tax=Escovopsis weberi TaxID=150374 RepID=A0A0M8N6Y8_ESCWE|nr:Stabilin-2 [Escovopsis weberi]